MLPVSGSVRWIGSAMKADFIRDKAVIFGRREYIWTAEK